MAYTPVSGVVPQFSTTANVLADGYYLKFYVANDITPQSMATDGTGMTLLSECKLNPNGYPISNPSDNTTVFIPHLTSPYRAVLYTNKTDADNDTTANAVWNVPDISIVGTNAVQTVNSIADLEGLEGSVDGQKVFRTAWGTGTFALAEPVQSSGIEVWDATGNRADHDGGKVKSPTVPAPTDFNNPTQVANYLNAVGETAVSTPGVWRLLYTTISMSDYGLRSSSTIDQTTPIQKTIDNLPVGGGDINIPAGQFLTTAPITGVTGMRLQGQGAWNYETLTREGTSSFLAKHTGASILSLKGCHNCKLDGFSLEGDIAVVPQTALILGRDSTASSGWHQITNISSFGYFTVCNIYSIASEDNYFANVTVWLFGGGGLYNLVSAPEDFLGIDSLVASTNLANSFYKFSAFNSSTSASSACIFLETGQSMGSWNFYGGYLIPHSGVYVRIRCGALDGLSPLGPFGFYGMCGEILGPVSPWLDTPNVGFDLVGSVATNLPGLTISGNRFQLINAAGTREILRQDANITLVNPNIMIPILEDPTTGHTLVRQQINGGIVDVGDSSDWVDATLENTWINSFGAPYAPAGYSIDPVGRVSIRGTVEAGTAVIFTLPANYRPKFNMFFDMNDGTASTPGRVLITAATGTVSVTAGTGPFDLNSIQYKL